MNDDTSDNKSNKLNIYRVRNLLGIHNPRYFSSNLTLIYNYLIKINGSKQLSKTNFYNYFKDIPLVIIEKIFNSFLSDNKTELSQDNFISNFMCIMFGNYDQILKLIFNIYDFSNKGIIYKHDVKLLLSYIPMKQEYQKLNTSRKFKLQQESQEELEKMLKLVFLDKSKGLTFKTFKLIIDTVNSDIFTIFFCFIIKSLPFDEESVDICEQYNIFYTTQYKDENCNGLDNFPRFTKPCKYNDFLISHCLDNPTRKKSSTPYIMSNKDKGIFDCLEDLDLNDGEEMEVRKKLKKTSSLNLGMKKESLSTGAVRNAVKRNTISSNNSNPSELILSKKSNSKGELKTAGINKNKVNSHSSSLSNTSNKKVDFNKTSMNFNRNGNDMKKEIQTNSKVRFSNNNTQINECNLDFEVFIPEVAHNSNQLNFKFRRLIVKIKNTKLFIFKDGCLNKDGCVFVCLRNYWISNVECVQVNKLPYFIVNITNLKAVKINGSTSKQSDLNNLKTINFYFSVKDAANNFIDILRHNNNQTNITDIYDFKQDLGEGSFGLVKYGIDKKTNEGVAIKILDKSRLPESKLSFINDEICIMNICCHPGLSKLINVHEDLNNIYLEMEYIPGVDLFSYLDSKLMLTEDYIRHIMKSIGEQVHYIHNFGIVHRDLKLDNIHININKDDNKIDVKNINIPKKITSNNTSRRGSRLDNQNGINLTFKSFTEKDLKKVEVNLIDFGISKVIGNDENLIEPMGTLRFSPPDILTGKPYNCKVDIWALGVCMYLLFCGDYPFEDECKESTTQRILYDELKFNHPVWKNASKEFIELIKSCLQKDHSKRINIVKFCKNSFFNR